MKSLILKTSLATLLTLPLLAGAQTQKKVDLRQAMANQCIKEVTYLKAADQATAQKLCNCTTNVQAQELKLGEFWEIQSATMNGQNPSNLAAVKRIEPKLQKCREGLNLKEPTLPNQ